MKISQETKRLLLNNNELKDIYKTSNNVSELRSKVKAKEMLNDINLFLFFQSYSDEEIRAILASLKIKLGNQIDRKVTSYPKTKTDYTLKEKKNEFQGIYKYRIVGQIDYWLNIENWMNFFLVLGKYISFQKNINIVISYIDEVVPAVFVSMGVIESGLTHLKKSLDSFENDSQIHFQPGEIALYSKNGIDEWRKARIEKIENISSNPKFNPYLIISVQYPNQPSTTISIPRYLWEKQVRKSGHFKSTAGSSVRMNDNLSLYLKNRYGDKVYQTLKFSNKNMVNIIGRSIEKEIKEIRDSLQFYDDYKVFTMKDYIYLNTEENNYRNVNIIKSEASDVEFEKDSVSLFIGSSVSLTFNKYRCLKNVFFVNRKKNNLETNDLFLSQILQESLGKNAANQTKILHTFLNEEGVALPRGLELYVYG